MRIRKLAGVLTVAVAAVSLTACGGTGTSADGNTITVYSADGLHDWYAAQFDEFEADTGIAVNLVEAGSGEVVSRVEKEKSNPQADLLVTLPPFIQRADESGLLQASGIDTSAVAEGEKTDNYVSLAGNYLCFIANPGATPKPATFDDLLKPEFEGKIQYSTPGEAGDGTAVLLLLQNLLGKDGALAYLAKLEANNVGPSSSTGKLQPKVTNGELLVANGDVQMNLTSIKNDGAQFDIFFPATADGKRTTISLPYVMGLTAGAPHAEEAKQLMEFLLSAEVQKTLAPEAFALPVRTDITGASDEASKALEGVEIYRADWNAVLSSLDADIKAYQQAIGG